jgi:CheY-like chemotaxis protein
VRRVLVLDDEPESRQVLKAIFERSGDVEVLTSSTPDEAIRLCHGVQPLDLIVCDIVLRSPMTGVETAFHIYETCGDLPILFTSGTPLEGLSDSDFELLRQNLHKRIDFVQKPFTATELIARADRLMNISEAPTEFVTVIEGAETYRKVRARGGVRVRRSGG